MKRFKITAIVILVLAVLAFLIAVTPLGSKIRSMRMYVSGIRNVKASINRIHAPIEADQIYIFKPGRDEIQIYNSLNDGNILLTRFKKKNWGVWNIEGWYIANDVKFPTKDPVLMAGGGSDWEYVMRIAPKKGSPFQFTGGNHKKEQLVNLRLLNDEDGAELKLQEGKGAYLKKLKIIETTYLTRDEKLINRYADIRRTYYISPSKIILDSDFDFNDNVYMGTSYVCMLPITKDYGRHIKFEDTGHTYATPAAGNTNNIYKSEEFNPKDHIGMEKTQSVIIWGDVRPSYKFRVWIGSEEMVDWFNNNLKVFYWDFNKYGNKLYFSKYDNEYREVSKGTAWHNREGWELQTK